MTGGNKILLEVTAGVITFVVIAKFLKRHIEPNKKMKIYYHFNTPYTGNLERDLEGFINEKEGGISNDAADKASDSPLKFDYNINGKLVRGIHTNKGVTVDTFFHYAPVVKIPATQARFVNMTNADAFKIFKELYYRPFEKSSDYALLNYMFGVWAWGSGVGTAKSLINSFCKAYNVQNINAYVRRYGLANAFENLIEHRIDFYNRLAVKDEKRYGKFLKGWVNSASNFYEIFKPYAETKTI